MGITAGKIFHKCMSLPNPFIPKISFSYSSYSLLFLWFWLWGFGFGSSNNSPIETFLYSHHLRAWYCMNIVRRNSSLVNHANLQPDHPLQVFLVNMQTYSFCFWESFSWSLELQIKVSFIYILSSSLLWVEACQDKVEVQSHS